jgi:hypothetical protein
MDMKKILQAIDSAASKPVEGVDSMSKFVRVVKEAELNQKPAPVTKPAPSKPATPPSSNLTADEMVAVLSGQKTQAQIMADREAKKADAGVKEGLVDGSGQPVQTGQPAPAQQSPEQMAYNQLRAQLDGADAIRGDTGANTFAVVSPEVTASTNAMKQKLAQMAAALKAKGIDAAAEYDAPDPAAPAAAPVDLAKKYVDENTGMSRLLSIVSEGQGPLNRLTQAESIAVYHNGSVEKRETITSPVLNVATGAKPSMIGKYFKAVENELAESNSRYKDRADQLAGIVAKKVMERVTIGPDGKVTGGMAGTPGTAPTEPAAPEAPKPLVGGALPTVDAANREAQTVTIDGKDYEMVHLEPGGIRPRGGTRYAIPLAMLGIRSIGRLIGILAGNKVYVLPKGEQ